MLKHALRATWRKRRSKALLRRQTAARRGLSTLEVVMITAVIFPPLALGSYYGMSALRALFTLIGSMVGSPLL